MPEPSPNEIVYRGDTITSDGIAEHCGETDGVIYWKRDFLFRGGNWRGANVHAFARAARGLRPIGLVVGHSDMQLRTWQQRLLRSRGVTWLRGTNVDMAAGFSEAIPLGLTNPTRESALHPVLGDARLLSQAYESSKDAYAYSRSVYANFNPGTSPRHRKILFELVQRNPDFVWEPPEYTEAGRRHFLVELRRHDFVLCPRGNGRDTHRLWETLYMGGIPVVLRDRETELLTKGLPVVHVQRWSDIVNRDFRETTWHHIRQTAWDYSRLSQSYWSKVINHSASHALLAET